MFEHGRAPSACSAWPPARARGWRLVAPPPPRGTASHWKGTASCDSSCCSLPAIRCIPSGTGRPLSAAAYVRKPRAALNSKILEPDTHYCKTDEIVRFGIGCIKNRARWTLVLLRIELEILRTIFPRSFVVRPTLWDKIEDFDHPEYPVWAIYYSKP